MRQDLHLWKREVVYMTYVPYASVGTFQKMYPSIELDEDEIRQRLKTASRHIDSLTYNRLVGSGKERLTPWQQEVLQEVTFQQAQFEYENEDEINMILSSYSINGVSAQFGRSWNVFADKGVAMKRDVYALLSQTGLCCRLMG